MNSPDKPVVLVKGLDREYAPNRGVYGINLTLYPGECFALIGRNGSGKTTLMRVLSGLEQPEKGDILILGNPLGVKKRLSLQEMGILLDKSVHWDKLSGWENAFFVAMSYRMAEKMVRTRLEELFKMADLSDVAYDPVETYSYGMRRKLGFIQGVCHEPRLLLLDEPTLGIDVHFLLKMAELLKTRSQKGLTTFIASNDPDWVAGIATKVAFIDKGKIIVADSVQALLKEVSSDQRIAIQLSSFQSISPWKHSSVASFVQDGTDISVILKNEPSLIPQLMDWIIHKGGFIKSVEVQQSSLRDVFVLKTGTPAH